THDGFRAGRAAQIRGHHAVDGDVVRRIPSALHVEIDRAAERILRGVHIDAGDKRHQVGDVAALHQDVFDLFSGDDVAALGTGGLNERGRGSYGDSFSDRSEVQSDIAERDAVAGRDHDMFALHRFETFLFDAQAVFTAVDGVEQEVPGRVGRGLPRH